MGALSMLLQLAGPLAEAAGPLITQVEELIKKAHEAKAEEHAAIIAEFQSSTAALIAARAQTATDHATMTEETRKAISDADAAMDAHAVEPPRP